MLIWVKWFSGTLVRHLLCLCASQIKSLPRWPNNCSVDLLGCQAASSTHLDSGIPALLLHRQNRVHDSRIIEMLPIKEPALPALGCPSFEVCGHHHPSLHRVCARVPDLQPHTGGVLLPCVEERAQRTRCRHPRVFSPHLSGAASLGPSSPPTSHLLPGVSSSDHSQDIQFMLLKFSDINNASVGREGRGSPEKGNQTRLSRHKRSHFRSWPLWDLSLATVLALEHVSVINDVKGNAEPKTTQSRNNSSPTEQSPSSP